MHAAEHTRGACVAFTRHIVTGTFTRIHSLNTVPNACATPPLFPSPLVHRQHSRTCESPRSMHAIPPHAPSSARCSETPLTHHRPDHAAAAGTAPRRRCECACMRDCTAHAVRALEPPPAGAAGA